MAEYASLPLERRREICKSVVSALQRVHTYTEIDTDVNRRKMRNPPPPIASLSNIVDAVNVLESKGIVTIARGDHEVPDVITLAPK